jgi:hypothetical protein
VSTKSTKLYFALKHAQARYGLEHCLQVMLQYRMEVHAERAQVRAWLYGLRPDDYLLVEQSGLLADIQES